MEAAGLALGIVSLAGSISGSFISIIQCFEYVQLSRGFGRDFEKAQIRLGALKLRLTRLGVALGVLPEPETGRLLRLSTNQEKATQAKRLVDSVLQDIREIEQKSKRYADSRGSAVSSDQTAAEPSDTRCTSQWQAWSCQANDIISTRLEGTSWTKRAKWACYEKRHFDTLLADISDVLGNLEALFPEAMEAQRSLCTTEVEWLRKTSQGTASLRLFYAAITENSDAVLTQAVREAIASEGTGHKYSFTEASEDSVVIQGDYISEGFSGYVPPNRRGHSYGVTIVTGGTKLVQGDAYGSGMFFRRL
ncbi:small s protein [Colletotrichum camelliae]|nr:small s protein [Colletotrichum camelliae]